MTESHLAKNLADKRKEIEAYIGSLEQDLEQARRDLSAINATERIFQARGPDITAYMRLANLFPCFELESSHTPQCKPALRVSPRTPWLAHVIAAKGLDTTDKRLRKAITYKLVQLLRQWEKKRKIERVGKVGTVIVWRQLL